jgi:hypothetical protein
MGKSSRTVETSSFVGELKREVYDAVVRYFAAVVAIYGAFAKTAHIRRRDTWVPPNQGHGFQNQHPPLSGTQTMRMPGASGTTDTLKSRTSYTSE